MTNVSDHTKFISLSNQQCLTRPTLIDLNPDEYNQRLCYCTFIVNLDSCNKNCNVLVDLSNRICVPNKIRNVNVCVFNMTTRINEYKTLTKHIS